MDQPNRLSHDLQPLMVPQNAIAALARVRNSYKGKSKPRVLTGADQAVLAAVKLTLSYLSRLANHSCSGCSSL
jgi:hypothetical protein